MVQLDLPVLVMHVLEVLALKRCIAVQFHVIKYPVAAEIASDTAPVSVLAERYNVTKATVRKWRGRQSMNDRSHRPHLLHTTLRGC